MSIPITFQRIEAGVLFFAMLAFYLASSYRIVWFVLFLLLPDISMIGYLFNNKVGAYVYNAGHSFILPLLVAAIGATTESHFLIAGSIIWLAHIGMDRALGYGLKEASGFQDTHLGHIGKHR